MAGYLDWLTMLGGQMGGGLGAQGGGMALPPIQAEPMPAFSSTDIAAMPVPNPKIEGSGLGGFMNRVGTGVQNFTDKLGGTLFRPDPTVAAGMTPDQIQQMQRQGMFQAGLGILGAPRGATQGQAIAGGLLGAQHSTRQQALQGYGLRQQESDSAKADARYTQQRADTLGQQATVNSREAQELAGRLEYWKGQIATQKIAAQRYGQASPTEMARLMSEERRYQRAVELARKGPNLTTQEKYELDFLTGGAVSRVDKADKGDVFGGAGAAAPTAADIAAGVP